MGGELGVRAARLEDATAIAAIYNEGIEDRTATLETEPRSAEALAETLRRRSAAYPALVVEAQPDGQVVAFAWASEYRSRPCYAGIAEHSVYVARAAHGLGAGRLALSALIEEAKRRATGSWPRGSSRRTRPAARCTRRWASGRWACTGATASWTAAGWTAS